MQIRAVLVTPRRSLVVELIRHEGQLMWTLLRDKRTQLLMDVTVWIGDLVPKDSAYHVDGIDVRTLPKVKLNINFPFWEPNLIPYELCPLEEL